MSECKEVYQVGVIQCPENFRYRSVLERELKMKEVAGMSSRCMPFAQEQLDEVCPCCGKPAQKMVYWGVAY